MWNGMDREIEELAHGLELVATNLELLNRRVNIFISNRQELQTASSFSLGLLKELEAKLKVMHTAPKAVIGDAAGLSSACAHEKDDTAAVGMALAAFSVVYDQLHQHYSDSTVALKRGSEVVRQLKSTVVASMAPASTTPSKSTRSSTNSRRVSDQDERGSEGDSSRPKRRSHKHRPLEEDVVTDSISTEVTAAAAVTATTTAVTGASPSPSLNDSPSASSEVVGEGEHRPRLHGRRRRVKIADDGMNHDADHHRHPSLTSTHTDDASSPVPTPQTSMQYQSDIDASEMSPSSVSRQQSSMVHMDPTHPHSGGGEAEGSDHQYHRNPSFDGSASFDGSSSVTSEKRRSRAARAGLAVVLAPVTVGKYVVGKTNDTLKSGQHSLFHNTFPEHADSEVLDVTSCAWMDGKVLKQGFWFLTRTHLCFASSVLSGHFSVQWDEIKNIEKKRTAVVFDNALELQTLLGEKFFLTSFLKRDDSFRTLHSQWTR